MGILISARGSATDTHSAATAGGTAAVQWRDLEASTFSCVAYTSYQKLPMIGLTTSRIICSTQHAKHVLHTESINPRPIGGGV